MIRTFYNILAWLCLAVFCSCSSGSSESGGTSGGGGGGTSTTTTEKPRYVWIDAAANFSEYANSKDNIRRDLTKAKNAGFTDVVVDVRPSMGDVLYATSYVD